MTDARGEAVVVSCATDYAICKLQLELISSWEAALTNSISPQLTEIQNHYIIAILRTQGNCPENVSFIPSIFSRCMSLGCWYSRETLIIFPWAFSWIGISSPLSVWFIGVPLKQGMNGEWTEEEKERSNNDLQLQLRSEITRLQGHQLRSEMARSKKRQYFCQDQVINPSPLIILIRVGTCEWFWFPLVWGWLQRGEGGMELVLTGFISGEDYYQVSRWWLITRCYLF